MAGNGPHPVSTIVARATAPGRGAVAIVRLSGPDAAAIARMLCGGHALPPPRQLSPVPVLDGDRVLDHGLWVFFPGPRSFTGEDVVELHLHGNPLLAERVAALAVHHGALAAPPGAFTRRAVVNGKLSLSQAEGLRELIDAPSPAAIQQAAGQLAGRLSERFTALETALLRLIAGFEAGQDYPEEGVESPPLPFTEEDLARLLEAIDGLLATHPAHQHLHQAPRVALVGRPNAGKSSLLNRLLGSERAIVSPTPGTTRDLVTATLNVGGRLVELVDTAGLRDSGDEIETEGIRRAKTAAAEAALCLLLVDATLGQQALAQDLALIRDAGAKNVLTVGNKMDLCPTPSPSFDVCISCHTSQGIDTLIARLPGRLTADTPADGTDVAINERHAANLRHAREDLEQAGKLLREDAPGEVIMHWLWEALRDIQLVEGTGVTEKMLDELFSRFCLGK